MCPLLGQSLGPLFGGALATTEPGWRSAFYFLVGFGTLCLVFLSFLPETYRKERSNAWRAAAKRAVRESEKRKVKDDEKAVDEENKKNEEETRIGEHHNDSESIQLARKSTMVSIEDLRNAKVQFHFQEINPLRTIGPVLRKSSNLLVISFSGILYASQYSLLFTASNSFSDAPYNYGSFEVGLVLLSLGVGNMVGSVGGGK
jgi:MFS family permease